MGVLALDETLEYQLGQLLLDKGLKLVVAESCTGGLIGHRLTNVPGSSEYYLGSVTAYAYEAKERLLGVNHDTLARFGAVSRETVLEMARGIRTALAHEDRPVERPSCHRRQAGVDQGGHDPLHR